MSVAPSYIYRAKLNRVIDGDTYVLDVDLGFQITAAITVRLRGVNSPEMSDGTKGSTARYGAVALLTGRELLVETFHDRRSFARWVADVWLQMAGEKELVSLAERLVLEGFAVKV